MNTKKGSSILVTCVAVIITLLAACSSPKPEITTAPPSASATATPSAPSYDISANIPQGYDEWEISGSSVPEPTMQKLADQFGLPGIFTGREAYAKAPFKGIVALETYCVITFMNVTDNSATLVILSRYNPDLSIGEHNVKFDMMKRRIDSYRLMCRGQEPVPPPDVPEKVTTA